MVNNKLDVVLFDFDDTLVHTDELIEFRKNRDRDGLIQNINKSWCYPVVPNLLKTIREKNIPIGIITNSPRWYIDILIQHHDLGDFSTIITYDDVGSSGIKPSPIGIKKALSNLSLSEKNNVIYIGDSDIDFVAAYKLGIKPVAPSWATRHPINQVPAAILNSDSLLKYLDSFNRISLIADQTASLKTFNFDYDQLNFIPLNEEGCVTALNKEDVQLLALGRYFSQKSEVTALQHESHQLSKDIFAKELSETYVIPNYYVELMVKVIDSLSRYKFSSSLEYNFDVVTVVPSKPNKNPRLENFLKRVRALSPAKSLFIPDLFEFSSDAQSSKTAGGRDARYRNLEDNLYLKHKYINQLKGKSVLVIDDVLTTGATYKKIFEILDDEEVSLSMGVVLAKTVSISEVQKDCPKCGMLLRISSNKKSGIHFLGCTGFYEVHNCKYKEKIKVKDCTLCGGSLVKKQNPSDSSYFLGCENYHPLKCRNTEPCD